MEKKLIYLFALATLFFACQPDPKPSVEETQAEENTTEAPKEIEPTLAPVPPVGDFTAEEKAKMEEIDSYTQFVISRQSHPELGFETANVSPKGGSSKDNLNIITQKGEIVRAVSSAFLDGGETRDYYFFREGKPVQFKHREWYRDHEPPTAKEILAYMEGDQVISLEERSIVLEQGQKPGAMLRLPMKQSSMDRDSFLQALNLGWETLKSNSDIK